MSICRDMSISLFREYRVAGDECRKEINPIDLGIWATEIANQFFRGSEREFIRFKSARINSARINSARINWARINRRDIQGLKTSAIASKQPWACRKMAVKKCLVLFSARQSGISAPEYWGCFGNFFDRNGLRRFCRWRAATYRFS